MRHTSHNMSTACCPSSRPMNSKNAASLAKNAQKAIRGATIILCSPLRRAKATAAAIRTALGVPVEVHECLREIRRDIGDCGGREHRCATCTDFFECDACVDRRIA